MDSGELRQGRRVYGPKDGKVLRYHRVVIMGAAGRDFHVQGITPEIADLSINFGPELSNDPADRLIEATSILRNAPIITADQNIRDATILETIW